MKICVTFNFRVAIGLFCVAAIGGLFSCTQKPDDVFVRWTGEHLPPALTSAKVAFERENPDYLYGTLVVKGKIEHKAFLEYAKSSGCELQVGPAIFMVTQSPPRSITWWKPPETQKEVYLKVIRPKSNWRRVMVWDNGEMFLLQNGPFE